MSGCSLELHGVRPSAGGSYVQWSFRATWRPAIGVEGTEDHSFPLGPTSGWSFDCPASGRLEGEVLRLVVLQDCLVSGQRGGEHRGSHIHWVRRPAVLFELPGVRPSTGWSINQGYLASDHRDGD